jgi:hypothetical protein
VLQDALRKADRLLDQTTSSGPVMLLVHSQEVNSSYAEIKENIATVFNTLTLLVRKTNGRFAKAAIFTHDLQKRSSYCWFAE